MAAEQARRLLEEAERAVTEVRAFDARQHTLAVRSCAPARPFLRERLFVCVPSDHQLAQGERLTFGDINGFNFLLRTQLGFWDALCLEKMPASKFLVQTEEAVFDELVRASSLPCFTTDYFLNRNAAYPGRVNIPLTDPEADVTFYVLWRENLSGRSPAL